MQINVKKYIKTLKKPVKKEHKGKKNYPKKTTKKQDRKNWSTLITHRL